MLVYLNCMCSKMTNVCLCDPRLIGCSCWWELLQLCWWLLPSAGCPSCLTPVRPCRWSGGSFPWLVVCLRYSRLSCLNQNQPENHIWMTWPFQINLFSLVVMQASKKSSSLLPKRLWPPLQVYTDWLFYQRDLEIEWNIQFMHAVTFQWTFLALKVGREANFLITPQALSTRIQMNSRKFISLTAI